MSGKTNMATVARVAGVSSASVSNAYNRPERLSDSVRERIFAVAQDLGYAGPDPAARSLRSRRAAAIGVLFTSGLSYAFSDPYCMNLLLGVSEEAERARTSVLLVPLVPETAGLGVEETRQSVQAVREAVIDGAIADGIADHHPALDVLRARGLPLVRAVDDPKARCVLIDDRAAGRMIGEHLAALGHREVAIVTGSPPPTRLGETDVAPGALFAFARLRLAGLRAGLGPDARVTVVAAGPNTTASGRAVGELILTAPERPSAIVAMSDALAFGVIEAARRRALEPGRDLAVTGFDDAPGAAEASLTTVRQPIVEKGRLMGRMLLDPAFGERRVVLPTELVVRGSTGTRR